MHFIRRTIVGGFFVLLPLLGAAFLLGGLLSAIQKLLNPVINLVSADKLGGTVVADLAAGAVIILICFVLGVAVEMPMGKALRARVESTVLERLPGYTFFKRLTGNLSGTDRAFGRPVIVSFDDNSQFGFVIDEAAEATVFLPSTPGVATGTVVVVPRDRVRDVDATTAEFLQSLSKWGFDSQRFLRTSSPPKSSV